MLTAFNLAATLERVGRANGARRPLAWMLRQRWGDPVVAAQLCGMLLFVAGGFSGIIQSSFTLNVALHNTAWVPAHFHMTLAGAVLLTFVSILYWLLPMLSGRALWSRRVALWQVYTWFAGMAVFGHNMGMAGIHGSPRRTDLGGANYINAESVAFLNYAAIGGALLLVSSVLLYLNLIGTLAWSRRAVVEPPPVDLKGDPGAPLWLERWRLWLAVIAVLAVVAWGPVLVGALDPSGASSVPAYRPESPVPLGGETR
jgi:cytochrome c oxidase subunit 1